jgi:hypothetical protein
MLALRGDWEMTLVYLYFILFLFTTYQCNVCRWAGNLKTTNNFTLTFRRSKKICRYWHHEHEMVSEHISWTVHGTVGNKTHLMVSVFRVIKRMSKIHCIPWAHLTSANELLYGLNNAFGYSNVATFQDVQMKGIQNKIIISQKVFIIQIYELHHYKMKLSKFFSEHMTFTINFSVGSLGGSTNVQMIILFI